MPRRSIYSDRKLSDEQKAKQIHEHKFFMTEPVRSEESRSRVTGKAGPGHYAKNRTTSGKVVKRRLEERLSVSIKRW